MILAFHKPYGVLSQFTPDAGTTRTLAEFAFPKGVYPIGRLDADSEGLLLLSNEPTWNKRLLSPGSHVAKTYHVLVVVLNCVRFAFAKPYILGCCPKTL